MSFVKTEAIVLRRVSFSNTSQIVYFYTRQCGQVHVMAQGLRRVKNRFNTTLDNFLRVEIVYYESLNSELQRLTDVAVLEHYPALRQSSEKIWAASYASELLLRLTKIPDPAPDIFALLARFLSRLNGQAHNANGLSTASGHLLEFEVGLLRILGFLPQSEFCVLCGNNLSDERSLYISPTEGGLICGECGGRINLYIPCAFSQGTRAVLKRLSEERDISRVRINRQNYLELRNFLGIITRNLCGAVPHLEKYICNYNIKTICERN